MRIVLVGCDRYQAEVALLFGAPVEVKDSVAERLMAAARTPDGRRQIIPEAELDQTPVRLRLTDRGLTFRSATVWAEGGSPVSVPAGLVPYLLERRRPDGQPLFEQVEG